MDEKPGQASVTSFTERGGWIDVKMRLSLDEPPCWCGEKRWLHLAAKVIAEGGVVRGPGVLNDAQGLALHQLSVEWHPYQEA